MNVHSQGEASRAEYNKNVANRVYGAETVGWIADYTDPADWLSVFFHTGSPNNTFGLHDANLDRQLEQADKTVDQAARMQLYNNIEQQVVNLVPWIPFEQTKFYWFQRPWVRGFGLNSLQLMPDINWANVYILDHAA